MQLNNNILYYILLKIIILNYILILLTFTKVANINGMNSVMLKDVVETSDNWLLYFIHLSFYKEGPEADVSYTADL